MTTQKLGRPPGLKKLPALHPATLCALAGRWTVGVGAPDATKREIMAAAACFRSTIDPRLAELVLDIAADSGATAGPLRDIRNHHLDQFAHVARVAAAVGDAAFFEQVAGAMILATKCDGHPVRLAVLEAWIEARKTGNPPELALVRAGVKYRLGRIDPDSPEGKLMVLDGHIGDDILRDHLKALGLKCTSRVSGKK